MTDDTDKPDEGEKPKSKGHKAKTGDPVTDLTVAALAASVALPRAKHPPTEATAWKPDTKAWLMTDEGALAKQLGLPHGLVKFTYTKEPRGEVHGTLCTATPK